MSSYYSESTWEPFEKWQKSGSCFFIHLIQSQRRYALHIYPFIYSTNSLKFPRVPDTVLDAGDRTISKTSFLPSENITAENSTTLYSQWHFILLICKPHPSKIPSPRSKVKPSPPWCRWVAWTRELMSCLRLSLHHCHEAMKRPPSPALILAVWKSFTWKPETPDGPASVLADT